MNRLNKTVQINPQFSWVDWELFDRSGSVHAASALNLELRDQVNSGSDRDEVQEAVEAVMHDFRHVGATDTEPRAFLERILDEIFGEL